MIELVHELHAHGIRIVAGTDDLAGFTLHRELELYAKAGIPNAEILQLATLGAARVMHRDAELGSATPGKLADLVIIDGDPVANISDVRKPVWVIKDGTLFDSKEVYRALGVN
jgi:imidazolonepropionase-like amidohydrolase